MGFQRFLKRIFEKKATPEFLETEQKYIGKIHRRGSVLLLHVDDAAELLDECARKNLQFLGVEAFRLIEEKIQPAMEFSNISFGQTAVVNGKIELLSFERSLQKSWQEESDIYASTKEMMRRGANESYDHYEVTIADRKSGKLMFFDGRLWEN